jgi:hypothetical protein
LASDLPYLPAIDRRFVDRPAVGRGPLPSEQNAFPIERNVRISGTVKPRREKASRGPKIQEQDPGPGAAGCAERAAAIGGLFFALSPDRQLGNNQGDAWLRQVGCFWGLPGSGRAGEDQTENWGKNNCEN